MAPRTGFFGQLKLPNGESFEILEEGTNNVLDEETGKEKQIRWLRGMGPTDCVPRLISGEGLGTTTRVPQRKR